eukprot:943989-Pleurochrysis_carterae.AAC.2
MTTSVGCWVPAILMRPLNAARLQYSLRTLNLRSGDSEKLLAVSNESIGFVRREGPGVSSTSHLQQVSRQVLRRRRQNESCEGQLMRNG